MSSSQWLVYIVVAASCLVVTLGASDASRVSKLDDMLDRRRDRVLSFSASTFRKYIEAAPRSYSVIVLFTADGSVCQPCPAMRSELAKVAAEYYALPPKSRAAHKVFFADLKLSVQDRDFLSDYGLEHVPFLAHFGPGKTKKYPSWLSTTAPDTYRVQELGISANSMKGFLNRRLNSKLKVMRGDYHIPYVSTVRALFPLILMTCAIVGGTAVLLGWYKQPMFWFVCCVMVYMYSVGGGHYTWINDSAFAVVDSNGAVRYISDGSRNQYAAEGVFVGFICTLISGIVILINELPKTLQNKSAQTFVGHFLCGVALLAVRLLLSLYNLKMPAYLRYEA